MRSTVTATRTDTDLKNIPQALTVISERQIEDQGLRSTLIAHQLDGALRFDIYLQGDRQTVFFDV